MRYVSHVAGFARGLSGKRPRLGVAVVVAAMMPAGLWGQGWQTSGNVVSVPAGTSVGIGTSTPSHPLSVNGLIDWGNNVGILSWDGSANAYISAAHGIAFAPNNGSAAMFVAPSGNVGIGTTNPADALQVRTGTDQNLRVRSGPVIAPGYTGVGIDSINDASNTREMLVLAGNPVAMFGGNVGIGTTSPTNLLTVGSGAPNFAATTPQIIAASTSDARSGAVVGQGGTFIRYSSAGYGDLFSYDYGTGGAKNLVLNQFGGNVGIGTTNPQNALSVNGTIQAKQVIVNTGWSDYVFAPTYRLQPLSEVASYIKTNGHLPDIPSAGEVEAKGVNLGEMQSKLLAKVEELTLHMIEAERENRELRERIARLEAGQAKH